MADRWVTDRVTDTNSPFHLRRDVLDEIDGGGSGVEAGGSIVFTQNTPAVGISPGWRNPSIHRTITFISLSLAQPCTGADYTVSFVNDGTEFALLTITAGSAADVWQSLAVTVNPGAKLSVETLQVGSTFVGAGGVAQIDHIPAV